MDTSWWVSKDQLDEQQRDFIRLPLRGRYQLEGPAGSGKTNLLLLRAQFVSGGGDKNVLVVTYTNSLCDFLRSGLVKTGLIEGDQVRTFHSWAFDHIRNYLGENVIEKGADFDEAARSRVIEQLRRANMMVPTNRLYDAIFVDEVQDLSVDELRCLLTLSENVCVCGDSKQGIYQRDGLKIADEIGLDRFRLRRHYRIGQAVARVADRLMPPSAPEESLEATSNYNYRAMGASSAELHRCKDRDEQFDRMCEKIRVQLDAFRGDKIGVFCGRRATVRWIAEAFEETDLRDRICYHNGQGEGFFSDAPIHIMTMHSAKGVEFRAVHLFGIEELRGRNLGRRTLAFTAITRAKTALHAYCTGATSAAMESAFASPKHVELEDLFPRQP